MAKINLLKLIQKDIPIDLKGYTQWVVWKGEFREDKLTKVPYNARTDNRAKSNDTETWCDFETAYKKYQEDGYDGIGFMLHKDDPFIGWDIDKCRNPETGKIDTKAQEMIKQLDSYTEISPSGTGIRIFIKGTIPDNGRKKGKIEVYNNGRYLTITGHHLPDTPLSINHREKEAYSLHNKIFGTKKNNEISEKNTLITDQSLLEKAFKSKKGDEIKKLFDGDWSNYPSQSEADQALCNHLAFWFDRNFDTINRILKSSGLYREKWDEKHSSGGETYGEMTINKAIQGVSDTYQGKNNYPQMKRRKPELKVINAADLMKMKFPEPRWAVPNILPEGLSIMAGKPKKGKSIFALNICISISSGGNALGAIPVEKGSVLYLALEDSKRRLQERINRMLMGKSAPELLHLATDWYRMDDKGLEKLELKIKEIPDLRLIVIDTLAKFKPVNQNKNRNLYDIDYEHISRIKDLADMYNICILLIHHLRKTVSDDTMDDFSGTFGLTGAADGLLALKREANMADAELHISGRDVEERQFALRFDPQTLSWNIIGDIIDVQSTLEKQKLYDAIKDADGIVTPKGLVETTGLRNNYIQKTLTKLVQEGNVKKVNRGEYIFHGKEGEDGKFGNNGNNGNNQNIQLQPSFPQVEGCGKDENIINNNRLSNNIPDIPIVPDTPDKEQKFDIVPKKECPSCKSTDKWWRNKKVKGGWICYICHPPAIDPVHVEWYQKEEVVI